MNWQPWTFTNTLFLFLIFTTGLFRAQLRAQEISIDWNSLKATFAEVEDRRLYRISVEEQAYQFTRDLCYAFEFRKAHGLNLLNPNPVKEAYLIQSNWAGDERLRRAYRSWQRLDIMAIGAIFSENANFVTARSRFTLTLLDTVGFEEATADCSRAIGRDVRDEFRYEIERNDLLKSGSSSFALYAGIFKGMQFVWPYAKRLLPAIKISGRTRLTSISVLGAVGIGVPTFAVYQQYISSLAGQREITEMVSDINPSSTLWKEWTIRRQLMTALFQDLAHLKEIAQESGVVRCDLADEACEKIEKSLALFEKGKDQLVQLRSTIAVEIAQEAKMRSIHEVELWIHDSIQNSAESSDALIDKMKFYVSAGLILDLLHLRSIHSAVQK